MRLFKVRCKMRKLLCLVLLLWASGCFSVRRTQEEQWGIRMDKPDSKEPIYFLGFIPITQPQFAFKLGMTKDEVIAVNGRPDHVDPMATEEAIYEHWIYRRYKSDKHLYFKDGILSRWEDRKEGYKITTNSR